MEQVQEQPPAQGLASRVFHTMLSTLRYGELELVVDDQSVRICGPEPGPSASLLIHRPWRVLRALLSRGDVGFGERYIAGDIDTQDLRALLQLLTRNEAFLRAPTEDRLPSRLFGRLLNLVRDNSLRGSRRNIAAHYDLGNDFYDKWLDQSMAYSAASFTRPEQPLRAAQLLKFARMLRLTGAQPGDHILEIGCGWGGFAAYASSLGIRVTGLTLSTAQYEHARQHIDALGLQDRVEIRLQDYREVEGQFDHIVSIEMFEAVGERHWPTFMERTRALLRPGGRAALQVITIDDERFHTYRRRADFIQRYVFPGGMLPSPTAFAEAATDAGLQQRDTTFHADDYALTIDRWRENFVAALSNGHFGELDHRFLRLWDYYLCLCEAGFRHGPIDLMRTVLTHR